MCHASPVFKKDHNDTLTDPVSISQWNGSGKIKGAYIISRINLPQIKSACDEVVSSLTVTIETIQMLIDSNLIHSSQNQIQQFSYMFLKLEKVYMDVVEYISNLSLCDNIVDIMNNYENLKVILDKVWIKLTLWGNDNGQSPAIVRVETLAANFSYDEKILRINKWLEENERSSPLKLPTKNTTHNQIIRSLNQIRPPKTQSFPGLLIGFAVGVGAIGSTLIGNLFNDNNGKEIEALNENIQKIDRKIILTNNRIDVLDSKITNAIGNIKTILDKIVTVGREREVYEGVLWNLQQITENIIEIKASFKLMEIIVTMLESSIINSELIQLTTLQEIIKEGLRAFPELEFPLELNRLNMNEALKLVEIKRAGHNKFLMMTPLFRKTIFDIFRIVPHPVGVRSETLIAEINEIILVTNDTYIMTNTKNLLTINNMTHVLNTIEPIWSHNKMSCEWASFNKNIELMLQLCNYKRVGMLNSTIMTELEDIRLIHFAETTSIELNCPNGKVRDKVKGMYKLPLYCDLTTDQVHWPGRQVKEVDLTSLTVEKTSFDITSLPIINIDSSDKITNNIKELISDLPDENSTLTFSFKDISLEQVKTYSVIAYSSLSVIVFTHSIILGLMMLAKIKRWWTNRKYYSRQRTIKRIKSKRDSFRGMRDSLRLKRRNWKNKARKIRNASLSGSQRSNSSSAMSLETIKTGVRRKISDHIPSRSTKFTNASTNTEPENQERSSKVQKTKSVAPKPALRRYV